MIAYAEALARIAGLGLAPRRARAPLAEAAGRILAEDIRLAADVPGFDRAAMDGFAIAPLPGARRYRIVGALIAGQAATGPLAPGTAMRIATGAAVPAGAAVVPWERVERDGDLVVVPSSADLAPGAHTARRGEDGRAGAVVIAAGTRLTPILIATAAMARAVEPLVVVPPRVAAVVTGDEVGAAVPDADGPLIAGLIARWGCPCALHRAGDDRQRLHGIFAAADCDVVVTTGGVGGSDRDLVKAAAGDAGFAEVFHGIAIQPGKPTLCMRHPDGRILIGLPGNPVAVLATAHLVLAPALSALGAGAIAAPLRLPLARAHRSPGARHVFRPGRRAEGGIELLPWNGSGDLIAAAAGTHLVSLPPGAAIAAGELVDCIPYAADDVGVLPERP